MEPRYLTTHEVADLLRTSPETVRYWRHLNKGPGSFKVGRRVLYERADVEAWITGHRQTQRSAQIGQRGISTAGTGPSAA